MVRLTLDLSQELTEKMEKRAGKSGITRVEIRSLRGGGRLRTTRQPPPYFQPSAVAPPGTMITSTDFLREELEFHYLHRVPDRLVGDISARPEVQRAIRLQDEMRRRLEDYGYSGSDAVRERRDRGW
jgi:hypothetical protein